MITRNDFFSITDQYGYPATDFERHVAKCSDLCVNDKCGRPFLCLKNSTGWVEFLDWKNENVVHLKTKREFIRFMKGADLMFKQELLQKKLDKIKEMF
jgi:hypothetical protein